MRFVLATNNRHKTVEIARIVSPIEVLSLPDIGIAVDLGGAEDGETYEENALAKARAALEAIKTAAAGGNPKALERRNTIVVADDSGVEAAALGGRPGVHSARYGGDGLKDSERYTLLLKELAEAGTENRGAMFVCVAAAVRPDGTAEYFRGECRGVIAHSPSGAGGFGYDPVFFVPECGRTMAEMPPEEKDRVSHRGKAFRRVRDAMLKSAG